MPRRRRGGIPKNIEEEDASHAPSQVEGTLLAN